MNKLLAGLLFLFGLLAFFCACQNAELPGDDTTHGSGVTQSQDSVDDETETQPMSEKETEADTGDPAETGYETEPEKDTDITTGSDSDTDSETTSPVIELPKVEFD